MLLAAPGRSWKELLFTYTDGIAQFTGGEPEPTVLRWADLATISLNIVSGYEGDSLSSCVLRDRAGASVTVETRYGEACDKVVRIADRLLAPRLARTLIARYDAGEPVTFGRLSVDQAGISSPGGGSDKPWSAAWRDTRTIEISFWAHRLTITPRTRAPRNVKLDSAPNDLLARYVIAHAAARAGVTGDVPADG